MLQKTFVETLRLQRFRSYRDDGFEFDAGVNIVVGPNASGKTNMLEAIQVAAQGASFRAKDSEMISFGADWGRIDSQGSEGGRTVKLLPQENGSTKKEFVLKDQKLVRMTLQKKLPLVLFEPNHLLLLHGSPDARREYLDNLIEQLVPGYAKARRDYRRILAQRNSLLKHGQATKKLLFPWNVRLSETGAVLATERASLVETLRNKIDDIYKDVAQSGRTTIDIRYQATYDIPQYGSSLLKALEERQETDIERGFTTVGPHREDIAITFDGRLASEVASRGETRTVLLVLKILELGLLGELRGRKPLLLLDDVFSELDGARRKALTEAIQGYQTFITTTDADVVVHHFMDRCRIIPLGG